MHATAAKVDARMIAIEEAAMANALGLVKTADTLKKAAERQQKYESSWRY